jgi:hypothetical protein
MARLFDGRAIGKFMDLKKQIVIDVEDAFVELEGAS